MLITTTDSVDGRTILEYKCIVFGEVITGANMFKDMAAKFRDVVGGRSATYEEELMRAREKALEELKENAIKIGANAVIGVKVDVEMVGDTGSMFMVNCYGTAVVID